MIILNIVSLAANIFWSFHLIDTHPYVALLTASGAGWGAHWLVANV